MCRNSKMPRKTHSSRSLKSRNKSLNRRNHSLSLSLKLTLKSRPSLKLRRKQLLCSKKRLRRQSRKQRPQQLTLQGRLPSLKASSNPVTSPTL